jgi:tetratricopeptide (TPR) repeat protein
MTPTAEEEENAGANVDYSGRSLLIASKREEGKNFYMNGAYLSSISAYSVAIRTFRECPANLTGDTLAVLLSNRAAGLLMVGAFHAAVADCELALQIVSAPMLDVPFTNDSGLLLKVKLYTRMARALLKLGDHASSTTAFQQAIQTAKEASLFSERHHRDDARYQNQSILSQMATEASLGQTDSKRLLDVWENISRCMLRNMNHPSEKSSLVETLGHVNVALTMAPGSEKLMESKVSLLANLKRWREVGGYCERLAAINVKWDVLFQDDLAGQNPFPDIPPARNLTSDFFGDARDEDAVTAEIKLTSRASAEAVLRVPFCLRQYYLRALRLEERYPAADSSLRTLEELIKRGTSLHDPQTLQSEFSWLPVERNKLDRTRLGRERGDELFRTGDFDRAAAQYAVCLLIDGEGTSQADPGGRLHAVLNCNRAACLMAVKRFHEAIDECTKALRIHSRYMKAMLRRARCFMRLQRFQEAISEYKRYLELVDEAKNTTLSSTSFVTPCLFDGPRDVSDGDVAQVNKELDDVHKAKRRADAAAKEEVDRRRDRTRWQDSFPQWNQQPSHSTSGSNNAYQRRDEWYNQQSGTRRWDSFSSRGPRPGHARSRSWNSDHQNERTRDNFDDNHSSHGRPAGSPGSDPSLDHYTVLNISQNATEDYVKKAYRKMALKYHPDKNKEEGAADKFRRVKLAYETLNDAAKRRQYDAERRLNRMF